MLANGAKLEFKKKDEESFKKLKGLKEIPEMGVEPEKIENTTLEDEVKQYENGVGDAGDMTYVFKYYNTDTESPYRLLRDAEKNKEILSFKETLKDGTITEFDAQVALKRTGGGVNGVIDLNVSMSLQSGLKITDPEISRETKK